MMPLCCHFAYFAPLLLMPLLIIADADAASWLPMLPLMPPCRHCYSALTRYAPLFHYERQRRRCHEFYR